MNDTFSKNLRKLRLDKQMTQEQVADKLGVSAQSVSRWETGATFPDILLLPEIARLYDVLVDDLFRENLQEHGKLFYRLVAEFGDAYRYDDFMAAVAEFERLKKEGPLIAEDYHSNAWLHMRMFQISRNKTLESVDKAMELCKDVDPEFYYKNKIFKVWFRAGEMGLDQQCIDEQLQAVKEAPENAKEWICLAVAYYWAKQYEECYRVSKDIMAKYPEESYIYSIAGDTCKELKKYEEAFLYWEKHYELDPDMLESLFSIAWCHEELGDFAKAYEAWMRLVHIFEEWEDDVGIKFPMRQAEKCKGLMGK
ncbi:MAG: helix-turn-helix domain-containing protein [Lachnospiraceae bacterium]|nr:helix-turn-helix domain-containing protein [Lachnospiraceae bacterium]